ncbi:MAG: MAPEG family protein, partial [Pseudomonadota bacterium]
FVLLLMLLGELMGTPPWLTAGIGTLLVAGRIVHAIGVSQEPEIRGSRTIGMGLTFTALLVAGTVGILFGLTGAMS